MRWWVLLFVVACAREAPPIPDARTEPIAPGAPLNLDKVDRAKVAIDVATARGAVKLHHAEHGRYPASLAELRPVLYFPKDLIYDAATGEVRSKTHPDL